jgi:hypothetical protein
MAPVSAPGLVSKYGTLGHFAIIPEGPSTRVEDDATLPVNRVSHVVKRESTAIN